MKKIHSNKNNFCWKKDDIERSTFYSFSGPFQLLHADFGNLEFLGKSATDPKYCLLFVDLFTSKVYVYPIKSRKYFGNKIENFYKEVKEKRKDQKTRLQTDQELKQKKLFELNKNYNVDMFSTVMRGSKAFAAKQKIEGIKERELLDLRL